MSSSQQVSTRTQARFHALPTLALAALTLLLSGCALQQTTLPMPITSASSIGGTVFGGQQAISGATVYLISIGNGGYGVPANPNILSTATTDANGSFTLPAFTCPTAATATMVEALGGNPGLAPGTNNSAIFLTALAGPCSNITTSTHLRINEVTTVATAYTMRPFANGNNVGATSTNTYGIANAYLAYTNLVNTATGTSPGASVPSGVSIPTATIDSLANSLTACVNTTGPSSPACSTLFTDTGVPSTGFTANTFNMAVAIASAPRKSATDIFNLASTVPPFQPALSVAPSDWTLGITYTAGNLGKVHTAMDIDFQGYVYVTTLGGLGGTLEILSSAGSLAGTNLLNGVLDVPSGIAIDGPTSYFFISSSAPGDTSISESTFYSNSSSLGPTAKQTSASFGSLSGVALDAQRYLVVADTAKATLLNVSPYDGSGGTIRYTASASVNNPIYFNNLIYAVDTASPASVRSYKLDLTPGAFTARVNGLGGRLAASASGHLYVVQPSYAGANAGGIFTTTYQKADSSYSTTASNSTYQASSIAVDGLGQIWLGMVNGDSRVNVFGPDFTGGGILVPQPSTGAQPVSAIQIDSAGNVWLANGTTGGLLEIIGAAAPVPTPLNSAQKAPGTRP